MSSAVRGANITSNNQLRQLDMVQRPQRLLFQENALAGSQASMAAFVAKVVGERWARRHSDRSACGVMLQIRNAHRRTPR